MESRWGKLELWRLEQVCISIMKPKFVNLFCSWRHKDGMLCRMNSDCQWWEVSQYSAVERSSQISPHLVAWPLVLRGQPELEVTWAWLVPGQWAGPRGSLQMWTRAVLAPGGAGLRGKWTNKFVLLKSTVLIYPSIFLDWLWSSLYWSNNLRPHLGQPHYLCLCCSL